MTWNVLFLCTGNSARSILAESILNGMAPEKFHAFSAGSHPKGTVHPQALALLRRLGHDTGHLRSKSWDEFAQGPNFDFVFTVCDDAAGEVCPFWPGRPVTAHWGQPDPAAVQGDEIAVSRAFRDAYSILERRIGLFAALPIAGLDRMTLKQRLDQMGSRDDAS